MFTANPTPEDRYVFNNPYAGDWENGVFTVSQTKRTGPTDGSTLTFYANEWKVSHTIVFTRKPVPPKMGSLWKRKNALNSSTYQVAFLGKLDEDKHFVVIVDLHEKEPLLYDDLYNFYDIFRPVVLGTLDNE